MTNFLATEDVENAAIDSAGLTRVDASELTIHRVPSKEGFDYLTRDRRAPNRRILKRIVELAIPPAWQDVRIAPDRNAHLQAVGRDEAGRLQYIYHEAWDDVRAAGKAFRLTQLVGVLGRLRAAINKDLERDSASLPLAAAARLVDVLHLRAGHEHYAGDEGGRGVATLLKRHIQCDKDTIRARFRGKGGKQIDKSCRDPKLAVAFTKLRRLRGQRLFQLKSGDDYRPMTASDLNKYLAETSGKPITAKDFRTLFASATALDCLHTLGPFDSTRASRKAIAEVARQISVELANTPAITRKSYIHPLIIKKYESGKLDGLAPSRRRRGLSVAESKLARFLETIGQFS